MKENLDNLNIRASQGLHSDEQKAMILAFPSVNIPVSGLSSILRSLQATLRVIIDNQQPQLTTPVRLVINEVLIKTPLEFHMSFTILSKNGDNVAFSEAVFDEFIGTLTNAARESSQKTLFGDKIHRSNISKQGISTTASERIYDTLSELARLKNVSVSYNKHSIVFNQGILTILE